MLLVKVLVLSLLGFVTISLFTGLYYLVKDKGQTDRVVKALTLRIGLSVLAIIIVLIAGATGVIEMNPNPMFGDTSAEAPAQSSEENPDDNREAADSENTSIFGSGGRRRADDGS